MIARPLTSRSETCHSHSSGVVLLLVYMHAALGDLVEGPFGCRIQVICTAGGGVKQDFGLISIPSFYCDLVRAFDSDLRRI